MNPNFPFSSREFSPIFVTLVLFFSLSYQGLWCQNRSRDSFFKEDLKFTHFDITDGLSNNYINSIAQDSLGFIWIATIAGLNRYDGREFKIFTKNNSGLADDYINQIYLSNSGLIYLATNGGVQTYLPKMDGFRAFSRKNSTLSNSTSSIIEFPNGNIAVGDYGRGIHIFDGVKEINLKNGDTTITSILPNLRIAAFARQGDSILWAGTYNEGLFKITFTRKDQIDKIEHVFSERTNTIVVDSQKNVWFGTDSGLRAITRDGDTIHITKDDANGLSDITVKAIAEDKNGLIWIGTRNGGLDVLDPASLKNHSKSLKIRKFLPKNDGSSVYHRDITSIKSDASGNIWIGTGAGLDFVDPQGTFVTLLNSKVNDEKKLSNDRIVALAKSKNGNIWIGTDGGGLDLYNPSNGNVINYSQENTAQGLSNNFVVSLLEDSKQRVWAGTYRGGLNKFDPKTGKWNHYLNGSVADGSEVRVIFEDQEGTIWAGTNRGGFYRYDVATNSFIYIESLGKMDVRDIEQLKKGELWLATYGNGIICFNSQTEAFEGYSDTNTNFPTNIIFNLEFIDSTQVLLGTLNEGLLKFNVDSKAIMRFTEDDGLSNNTVSSILRDPAGVYWLGTYNGITQYDPVRETVKNLNNFDNIKGNEFNNGAAIISKNGTVYMGSNGGLNIFNSKKLKSPKKHLFKTVFTDLEFYNKSVSINGKNKDGLEKSIAFKDSLTISYHQSLFSLDFAGLKYPSSENVEYSYLLEGYNDHWVNLKNFNKINFSQIPAGQYTLRLKTNPNDYFTSSTELFITIIPPFWKTLPAYILYFLTLVLILWLSLRYYTNRFRLKQSLLFEKNQRHLENDLNEERLRFYTGFSHELKTPLAMILAPVESLLMEVQKKEHVTRLRIIDKNARTLLLRINKLLNFRQTEEGLNKLNVGKYNLAYEINKCLEMYAPVAQKKGIKIKHNIKKNDQEIFCDLEKVQILFNNLMSNAIKYTQKGDFIKITLKATDQGFFLKVKDTGKGIPQTILPHIFEWYYHANDSTQTEQSNGSGIGLALSKRFIELHKGTITVTSKIGVKTIFSVFLPWGTQHEIPLNNPIPKTNFDHIVLDISNENKKLEARANLNAQSERELLLLIDDNPDIHEYLSSILSDYYDILHALNGAEGIKMGIKQVPDLIISDIMMPQKSGIDLCKTLKGKKETSHIPIILLSAKDTKQSIIAGYDEGADDYITKPFSAAILMARIKNLLRRKVELQKDILGKENLSLPATAKDKQVKIEKKFLQKFEKVVLGNLQIEGKSVEIVSTAMGMSTASLYRKIKAITGKSINEYIRDIKLQKAVNLMENEGLNVSQSAFEVGFKNLKYFRKIFKEKFGKLPSDFSMDRD